MFAQYLAGFPVNQTPQEVQEGRFEYAAWESVPTMARTHGVSDRTVQRWIGQLVKAGVVVTIATRMGAGGRQTSNWLTFPGVANPDVTRGVITVSPEVKENDVCRDPNSSTYSSAEDGTSSPFTSRGDKYVTHAVIVGIWEAMSAKELGVTAPNFEKLGACRPLGISSGGELLVEARVVPAVEQLRMPLLHLMASRTEGAVREVRFVKSVEAEDLRKESRTG